jgi:hypothetical protein
VVAVVSMEEGADTAAVAGIVNRRSIFSDSYRTREVKNPSPLVWAKGGFNSHTQVG